MVSYRAMHVTGGPASGPVWGDVCLRSGTAKRRLIGQTVPTGAFGPANQQAFAASQHREAT